MIALSFSFPHHGKFSSYHRLLHYLDKDDTVVDATLPPWTYQRLCNPRGLTQKAYRSWKESAAWSHANKSNSDWMHYLYPEHGYYKGKKYRQGQTRIAMSCHLPKNTLEAHAEIYTRLCEGFSIADALIVMSPDYVEYYQQLAPRAEVRFIPHGIDIHYFCPGKVRQADKTEIQILTVGTMLRDFKTLASLINLAVNEGKNWKFVLLSNQESLDTLQSTLTAKGMEKVRLLRGIGNEELLRLYQESALLYLPLLDATANNAVVESMACGLPMLLTDFPATRAYAGDTAFYVKQGDYSGAFEQMNQLLSSPSKLEEAASKARHHAVTELAWEAIIQKHQKLFEEA
jgi:glycosyltransferase involved in cell wall biosynthesis